jgi:hypothetical protein
VAKDLGQFSEDVRKHFDAFKVAGIIVDYTAHRGGVRIMKRCTRILPRGNTAP